jgi:hypothetical protein
MSEGSAKEEDSSMQHDSAAVSQWRVSNIDIVSTTGAGAHADRTGYPVGQSPTMLAGSDGDNQALASGYEGTSTAYNHASENAYEGANAGDDEGNDDERHS